MLVDLWEELVLEHQRIDSVQHDAWPRSICWTRYLTRCSCGTNYPVYAVTDTETRRDAHITSAVHNHRELHHMKHLVQRLLDEEDRWSTPALRSRISNFLGYESTAAMDDAIASQTDEEEG